MDSSNEKGNGMMDDQKREIDLKLFVVLSRAYRAILDHVKKDIKSHGLNPTEFAVLELLYHKGPQPLQQIGEKILITSGSITYVVDKLEQKKYLMRKPCGKDRRIIYGTITEEGTKFMDEIFPSHHARIQQLMHGLDDEEKEQAIQLLKKLGLNVGKAL